jgi:hypothetical protein
VKLLFLKSAFSPRFQNRQAHPNDYYRRIFELNSWELKPDSKRPGVLGHWTNDLVYDRLGPGLREQLHDFAGRNEKRRLRHHLTQFLTTNHGIPELRSHLDGLVALMKAATSWDQFKEMTQRVYPKPETTLSMALNDLDQIGRSTKAAEPLLPVAAAG